MDTGKHTPADKPETGRIKPGWLGWLIAIGPPFLIGVPLVGFLIIFYLGTEKSIFLILAIIYIVLAALYVFFFIRSLKKPIPPLRGGDISDSQEEEEEGAALGAALFTGLLGGFFLGRSSRREDRNEW